ncbi:MAG: hypothetical protein OEQ90_01980 [Gammaproteobacteria bacterium]|nr:hypothetical protein [Gammaproteobacteria bacterium]
MNGENSEPDEVLEEDSSEDLMTETVILTEVDDDALGDTTIELSIEKLVEKLDATDDEDVHRRAEIRRRLEDLREQREKELDSTFNFNLDEDI